MNTDKLQYEEAIYTGREYKRSFHNDDGSVTKSYAYQFKTSEEQQWPIRYWGYDTTKGAEELVEGEVFTIGFVNKPNPRGDKPLRVAKFFGKPNRTQGSTPNVAQNETTTPSAQSPSFPPKREGFKPTEKETLQQWITAASELQDDWLDKAIEAESQVGKFMAHIKSMGFDASNQGHVEWLHIQFRDMVRDAGLKAQYKAIEKAAEKELGADIEREE